MALERNISLESLESILKKRGLLHKLDYILKRLRMKGWNMSVSELLELCGVNYKVSESAKPNMNKKVQSVCTVNEYFEKNSICVEMYWTNDEDLRWAVNNGASVLITKRQIDDLPCIIVENPLDVYAKMCLYFRELHKNVSTTIVIGSIGKTTTKRMIESVYEQQYNTFTNPTNRNLLCHTGYDVQHIPSKVEKTIQEVSEDTPGYAQYSSIACKPKIVVITSIDKSHFEAYGSQDAIAREICSVTKGMEKDGTVIINKDNFKYYELIKTHKCCTVSTTDKTADIYSENIEITNDGLIFDIIDGNSTFAKIKLNNIYAKHNVLIALYAYAAGKIEGVNVSNIIKGIENYKQLGFRQNIFRTSNNVLIYADCYNAVAKSMIAAINSAEIIPLENNANNKRIAVLGDVEEAGELSNSMHEEIIRCVNGSNFSHLIITGSKLITAYKSVATREDLTVILCDNRIKAINELRNLVPNSGDLVLFKSSHSGHLEEVMLSVFPETRSLINEERKKELVWRKKIAIS